MSVLLSKLLVATLLCGLAHSEVLNSFIRHYEPLHYDEHNLMWHHHRVRRSLVGPRDISLQFTAFDRDFDLLLHPEKNIFSPNFKLSVDGQHQKYHQIKSFIYSGTARDDPSVRVHGNLVDGVFHGSVFTSDELYHIEPASRYFNSTDFHSVIYRSKDVDSSTVTGATCGSTHDGIRKSVLKLQQSYSSVSNGNTQSHLLKKRQSNTENRIRCWLRLVGDSKYYEALSRDRPTGSALAFVGAQLTSTVLTANRIFEQIDFNGDGAADGIQFGILSMAVDTMEQDPQFNSEFLGVEAFLDLHSTQNYSDYCLAYRFTNRDFEGGVVGLAYVAPLPNQNFPGGICQPFNERSGQTLNTGIVTVLNYGEQVPSLITALTFAHEAGHNFGSNHDPQDNIPEGGAFIMHPFSTNGRQPNNMMFSAQSIRNMSMVIASRGQGANGCFADGDDLCGNMIVDEGEDCDCGRGGFNDTTGLCFENPCCLGRNCTLDPNVECSPDQGPCCSSECMFIEASAVELCSPATECANNQTCNGSSAMCPTPISRDPPPGEEFILCNDGSNTCDNGTCTGSICVTIGLDSCNCIGDLSCHVCCILDNGTCASTIAIATEDTDGLRDRLPDGMGRFLEVGFPCGNFTGYCDFFNRCMIVEEEGALSRLANLLFNSEGFRLAIQWVQDMWWAVLLIGVGILVIMFVVVLIFHLILPRPEHVKKRAERRKTIRRSRKQQPQLHEMKGHHAPSTQAAGYPSNYPQSYPQYYNS